MSLPTLFPCLALAEGTDAFGPGAIWASASGPNRGIISILLFLLALQIYIAVERTFVYLRSNAATRPFLKQFLEALRRGDFEAARRAAAEHERSHVAMVLRHGLERDQALRAHQDRSQALDGRSLGSAAPALAAGLPAGGRAGGRRGPRREQRPADQPHQRDPAGRDPGLPRQLARIGQDGSFGFCNVKAGTYTLSAANSYYETGCFKAAQQAVVVAGKRVVVDVQLQPLK